jgi:hypothetical protein
MPTEEEQALFLKRQESFELELKTMSDEALRRELVDYINVVLQVANRNRKMDMNDHEMCARAARVYDAAANREW